MHILFDRTIGQLIGISSILLGVLQIAGAVTDDPVPVGKVIISLLLLSFGVFVFKKARDNQN